MLNEYVSDDFPLIIFEVALLRHCNYDKLEEFDSQMLNIVDIIQRHRDRKDYKMWKDTIKGNKCVFTIDVT